MSTRRPSQHRRRSAPPKEGLLVKVVGDYLDPIDALSATFFSILFALLFTLSYSILMYNGVISTSFSTGYSTELFFAILGAVAIWGTIDGVMYALTELFQRGERHRLLQYLHAADKEETAVDAIADELDFILEPITNEKQRYQLYDDILAHLRQAEPQEVGLQRADVWRHYLGAGLRHCGAAIPRTPAAAAPKYCPGYPNLQFHIGYRHLWHRLYLGKTYRYQSLENGPDPGICLPEPCADSYFHRGY
ncbi:MAG: hypothetical protein R6X34_05955 [Chloroflexota bacterium]